MNHVVTIGSKLADGGQNQISIEVLSLDTATITIRTWSAGKAGPPAKPTKTEVEHMFDVRVANPNTIRCRVSAFGSNPFVGFVLDAGAGPKARSVTIEVHGTFAGLGDRTDRFALIDTDYLNLLNFVAESGFPSS